MEQIFQQILYTILAVGILAYLYSIRPLQRLRYRTIPGVPIKPVVGNRKEFVGNSLNYELYLSQKYPQILKIFIGGRVLISATDIDMFRKLSAEPLRDGFSESTDFKSWAIFYTSPETNAAIRKLLAPTLGSSQIRTYLPLMNKVALNQVAFFKGKERKGEYVNIFESTKMILVGILFSTIVGVELNSADSEDFKTLQEINQVSGRYVDSMNSKFWDDPYCYVPELKPVITLIQKLTGKQKKKQEVDFDPGMTVLKVAMQKLNVNTEQLVKALTLGPDTDLSKQSGPGLGAKTLINGKLNGNNLTLPQIAANLTIIMQAGQTTTSVLLGYAIYCLSNYKEKEAKLLKEIDLFGREKEVTESDIDKLPYLEAVIKETLRLFPPILANYRKTQTNQKIGNFNIPSQSVVRLNIRAIHRNEKYYNRPLEFIPERWLGQQDVAIKAPQAFVPFGFGSRMCAGMRYGLISAQIALIRIYQNLTFTIPSDLQELTLKDNFTIKPEKPLLLQPVSRNT